MAPIGALTTLVATIREAGGTLRRDREAGDVLDLNNGAGQRPAAT